MIVCRITGAAPTPCGYDTRTRTATVVVMPGFGLAPGCGDRTAVMFAMISGVYPTAGTAPGGDMFMTVMR